MIACLIKYMYYIKDLNKKRYVVRKMFENDKVDELLAYLKDNGITFKGTPYIFTHIEMSDGSIISQDYQGIITSPEKLRKLLTE